MKELSKIKPSEKLEWKQFVSKYHKVVRKEVRRKLGFWRYHFTGQAIMGEFVMLNSAWTDMKKKKNESI